MAERDLVCHARWMVDRSSPPARRHEDDGASDALAQAEASLAELFLGARALHLVGGLISLTFDRERYRRLMLARALFVAAGIESVWLAKRLWRARAYDSFQVAALDTVFGAIGVAVSSTTVSVADQFNPTNWMEPLTLFSAIGVAGGARNMRQGLAATALMSGAFVAATAVRSRRLDSRAFLVVGQYFGSYAIGVVIAGQLRRSAKEIEKLREETVRNAGLEAQADERSRIHAEVHDGALGVLRSLQRTLATEPGTAQRLARWEAGRLRRFLSDDRVFAPDGLEPGAPIDDVETRLVRLVDEAAAVGPRIELLMDFNDLPHRHSGYDALVAATTAALGRAVRLAPTGRVVVRATADDQLMSVVVRDYIRDNAATNALADVEVQLRLNGGTLAWERSDEGSRVRMTLALADPS